jgi:hypothetical protein
MSAKAGFLKVFLCLLLGMSVMSGAPMDAKQIEEHLRLMNETRVEVVMPADKDKGYPE